MSHSNEIGRKLLGSWGFLPGFKMAIGFVLRHTFRMLFSLMQA